jgi:GTP-binding protein Era
LVGRPNAGKSTLLNRLLGEKLAIVSAKPQTTRNRLVGLLSGEKGQMVLFDTPGIHKGHHRLNRRMVKEAFDSLRDADVVVLIVDASAAFGAGDNFVLERLATIETPKVLALNKVDAIAKLGLLPLIERYSRDASFDEIVPISARTGDGVEILEDLLWQRLPEAEALYDPDLLTVHPERFLAAERIREKVLERTRDELPFSTAVLIDEWLDKGELIAIEASVLVERENQRKIVIGKGASLVKAISMAARTELEDLLGRRVYLRLHVRQAPRWRESASVLDELEREVLTSDLSPADGPPDEPSDVPEKTS